eukprot:UN25427
MLKEKGYVTGMAGKWHLGINSFNNTDGVYLPKTHGFDMVGPTLPFSNHWLCDETKPSEKQNENCFIYNADRIIQQPIKHENLTHWITEHVKTIITTAHRKQKPFFIYVPFAHLHVSLFTAKEFVNSSARGPFGDNVRE